MNDSSSSRSSRIAMVSTHGYVAAAPPLGEADTGGQVVYVLELSKKLGQFGYEVDIWTRQFEDQPALEVVQPRVRILRVRSRYEPFGMTAVEAMASGTPTVLTIQGGLFRGLRFGIDALFADSLDPLDLGNTILKPLQYPEVAERLSKRGAETARKSFTWTAVAQDFLRAAEQQAIAHSRTARSARSRAST